MAESDKEAIDRELGIIGGGMEASSVMDRVKRVVIIELKVAEGAVVPEARFIHDLGADSLDVVALVMALENEFEIEIPDEDVAMIITVEDAVRYITDYLKYRGLEMPE